MSVYRTIGPLVYNLRHGIESVGLDSEKRIVSGKMRKERKKRGKEAKRWGKEANLTS